MIYKKKISQEARKKIIVKANSLGGAHIGGSFSILDFLISFYLNNLKLISKDKMSDYYYGISNSSNFNLIFSKGHCYIAQLAVLDAIFKNTYYLDQYFVKDSYYFGHPKKNLSNFHFPVSTGSLGQGIAYANGLALANKINNSKEKLLVVVGDGELNEGSCSEAILFASHHKLNISFIIDNNNQMSLGYTSDILSNGNIASRYNNISLKSFDIDGHNYDEINEILNYINNNSTTNIICLNTIKGKGVSFMEKNFKWHHRRFKNNEYEDAMEEINAK